MKQEIINRASARSWLVSRWKSAVVEGRVPLRGYDRLIIPEAPRWRGAVLKRRDFLIAAGLLSFAARTHRAKASIGAAGQAIGGIGGNGFLPSGHWLPAALPYAAIYPQSSGTKAYARHLKAYYDGTNAVPMILPMGMQGLALPIVWSIDEAPAGTTIGMVYSGSANASGSNYGGYGDLIWYPQASFSSGSPADFIINGTGQDHTTQQLSWSTSTSSATSDFIFADANSGSDSGSATYGSPLKTLAKIYGATQAGSTSYSGSMLYLFGNSNSVNFEAYDMTGASGITLSGGNNPIAIMGVPGGPVPNIDISNLTGNVSNHSYLFYNWDDASDLFLQGFTVSGSASGGSPNFAYFFENYQNNRLTYHNISAPNVWSGTNPVSGNAGLIQTMDNGPSGTIRQFMMVKGVGETNRTVGTGNQSEGLHGLYNFSYGVTEFCYSSNNNGTGAFLRKGSISYWSVRYCFSQCSEFPYIQFGQVDDSQKFQNGYFEDSYNRAILTGSVSAGAMVYNDTSTAVTGPCYTYRCSLIGGAYSVGNNAGTGPGPFASQANAIQYVTQAGPITYYNTTTSAWEAWTSGNPSNITDTNAECEASSGVFDSNYNLTGSYRSSYLYTRGAEVG